MIHSTLQSEKNSLTVAFLCECAGVSRSGYYSWLATKKNPKSYQNKREEQDRKDFELILEAYKYRGINKGRRGIHMRLLQNGILMNEKKIARLMKKYNLVCPIRKANPY